MFLEELALGPLASLHLVERVRNLGLRRTRVLVGDVLRCAERVIARRACRDTDERTDRRYGNCERTNTLLAGGFLHYHSFFRILLLGFSTRIFIGLAVIAMNPLASASSPMMASQMIVPISRTFLLFRFFRLNQMVVT